jgi:hypothetical protein
MARCRGGHSGGGKMGPADKHGELEVRSADFPEAAPDAMVVGSVRGDHALLHTE